MSDGDTVDENGIIVKKLNKKNLKWLDETNAKAGFNTDVSVGIENMNLNSSQKGALNEDLLASAEKLEKRKPDTNKEESGLEVTESELLFMKREGKNEEEYKKLIEKRKNARTVKPNNKNWKMEQIERDRDVDGIKSSSNLPKSIFASPRSKENIMSMMQKSKERLSLSFDKQFNQDLDLSRKNSDYNEDNNLAKVDLNCQLPSSKYIRNTSSMGSGLLKSSALKNTGQNVVAATDRDGSALSNQKPPLSKNFLSGKK